MGIYWTIITVFGRENFKKVRFKIKLHAGNCHRLRLRYRSDGIFFYRAEVLLVNFKRDNDCKKVSEKVSLASHFEAQFRFYSLITCYPERIIIFFVPQFGTSLLTRHWHRENKWTIEERKALSEFRSLYGQMDTLKLITGYWSSFKYWTVIKIAYLLFSFPAQFIGLKMTGKKKLKLCVKFHGFTVKT